MLHELGQPLHAFDADKLDNQIIVKTCKENTSFTTLDGIKRNLNKDDLMICDNISHTVLLEFLVERILE